MEVADFAVFVIIALAPVKLPFFFLAPPPAPRLGLKFRLAEALSVAFPVKALTSDEAARHSVHR
jgi:hypothetical protein